MFKYLLLLLSIFLGVLNQLLIKIGSNKSLAHMRKIDSFYDTLYVATVFLKNYWILAALFFYAFGFFVWIFTLTKFDLSYAFPLMATTYIFIMFFSWLILDENITIIRMIGTVVIMIGVFLVMINK